nr:dnaJ homolog subfamily C member 30, mitochondrial [Parasteatoda tepidariorum]
MFRAIGNGKNCRHYTRLLLIKQNSDISLFRYKSHYTSLGLESNASSQDIKSAYYKLSLKYHPDKNKGSAESVEKFREISEAYEVLGNLSKKKIYDESLSNRYSESDWRRQHYSPRSYQYSEPRSKPRTGRSKYYNYDEHYKQHYEEYEKQRQAEFEYFKRRWEADFRRRYPFSEKPDWTEYEQKQQNVYNEWQDWKKSFSRRYLLYFLSLWGIFFLFSLPELEVPPPYVDKPKVPPKPIYYKVRKEEDSDEEPSEK